MTKDKLIALADRVELADGPSRQLDAEIFLALNPNDGWYVRANGFPGELYHGNKSVGLSAMVSPYFSSSIDAALTLIPDGWELSSLERADKLNGYSVMLRKIDYFNERPFKYIKTISSTAPLAIIAASLRAVALEIEE